MTEQVMEILGKRRKLLKERFVTVVHHKSSPRIIILCMATCLGALSFATPFSRKIVDARQLRKVKVPNLELYDRTTHPKEHVRVYMAHIYV